MISGLFVRRAFISLLGVTCLLVLLIYTFQQGLSTRGLLIKHNFLGGSRSNVNSRLAGDFSKAISRRLGEVADEDASVKKKDDIEGGQVTHVGRKLSSIQMSQSAHTLY
jgi:hypothetical protein